MKTRCTWQNDLYNKSVFVWKKKQVESNDSPKKAHKHDSHEQIKWKITFFWDKNGNFSWKPNNIGFENSKLSWLNNTSPVAFLVLYDLSDIRTTAFLLASEHNITGIMNIILRGKDCMLMRQSVSLWKLYQLLLYTSLKTSRKRC